MLSLFFRSKSSMGNSLVPMASKRCCGLTMGRVHRLEFVSDQCRQATSFYKVKGNEEAISAQNGKAARLVHIKRSKVVRPVHAKRTYHASHHEGHTSLRSSGWWANNWPRTKRSAVLHKSQLAQKYPTTGWKYATKTTGWKYATKGYRRHARSGDL